MKSFTSLLAWLLMAAVLAVPSFLFYNWWSNSKKQVSTEISQGPGTAPVFPSEGGAESDQPAQPAVQAPDVQPAARPAPERVAPATRPPAPAAAAEAAPLPPPAQPAAQPAVQPAAQAAEPVASQPEARTEPAAQQGVEGSTIPKSVSHYAPKTERDPTFSPDDYRRIRDEAMRRAEAERMVKDAERYKPREPGPETRVVLQGIVGNAAIINGDMYTAGQTVRGVKLVKVGADYIICDYKGKKFRKVLK
jgi:hypothetical protein